MNLKKNLGRIAATLLSTAMLASVAAVPAFAEDTYNGVSDKGTQYENGQELTDLTFKKVLKLPENVPVPTVEFEFTLSGAEAEEGEQVRGTRPGQSTSVDVVTGEGSVSGTASFNKDSATTETEKEGVVQTETVVNIPLNELKFDNVGAYKFTLHEDAVAGNFADSGEYTVSQDSTVYLYVERTTDESTGEEDYIVTGIVMMDPGAEYSTVNPNNGAKSEGVVVNTYLLDENGEPKDNELIIEKEVDGPMANREDEFEFKVHLENRYKTTNNGGTFAPDDPTLTGKTYKLIFEIWDEEKQAYVENPSRPAQVIESEKANANYTWRWVAEPTFMLKHNERVRICGVTTTPQDGPQIDIAEVATAGHGKAAQYKASWEKSDGTSGTGYKTSVRFADENVTVHYTNTRDAVSPTGLAMDIAPYALLVVVAAAGCFVFMRKRRED